MAKKAKDRIGPTDLGIDLSSGSDREVFRWLVACQLFGARVAQEIGAKAFAELDKNKLTTPDALAKATWQDVSQALDRGDYTRYDDSTAKELVEMGRIVVDKYDGSIGKLHEKAPSAPELITALEQFKGVGPTTAGIFVRELRGIWV